MKGLEMVKCKSLRINMLQITHTGKSVNFPVTHGQFNNSFQSELPTNRSLERLHGFYDLDLFKLNTNLDARLNTDNNLFSQNL